MRKLESASKLSKEPLYIDDGAAAAGLDLDVEFSWLPWYLRIFYTFLSFFTGKSPKKAYENRSVAALGKKINKKFPGLYNYQEGLLLPQFYNQIVSLKEAAHFFYSALETSVNRDRAAFFSFLGSLEIPEVHQRLQGEADPAVIVDKYPGASEAEWRQLAFRAMEDALSLITAEHRAAMYYNARSLYCLKELAVFPYDRLISSFGLHRQVLGESAYASQVKDLLESLGNILLSLKTVPQMALFESLFVFFLQRNSSKADFDMNREIRVFMARAEHSLSIIRDFNRLVPLVSIIRCASRDMTYVPKEISGGEDWFVIYRDYWKRQIEILCNEHLKDRRQQELHNSFRGLFDERGMAVLDDARTSFNPERLPLQGEYALAFLYTFCTSMFNTDINRILEPIVVDGEFIKDENRVEFIFSYNYLLALRDEIIKFEQGISSTGIYGERYVQARDDANLSPARQRRMKTIIDRVQQDLRDQVLQTREVIRNMVNLLRGLSGKGSSDKYQSLSNLAKFTGRDNLFSANLERVISQFQTAGSLLETIENL